MFRIGIFTFAAAIFAFAVSGCSVTSEAPAAPGGTGSESADVVAEPADGGYDVTAYFAVGKAVKGVPQLSAAWNGATYLFSSEESRQKFKLDPERYLPEFGSHCPVSLSKGRNDRGRPTAWRIFKDRLYFFGSEGAAKEFDEAPEEILKKAASNDLAIEKK